MSIAADLISKLDAPRWDGDERELRVGTWPDVEKLKLTWNSAISKWVSKPIYNLVDANDLNWLDVALANGNPATFWAYLGYPDNSSTPQANYSLRPLRRVAEFYAAGLRLQDRSSGRCMIASGSGQMDISPVFYPFDDNELVAFANDVLAQNFKPSPNGIGRGSVLSHTTVTIKYHETPWQDVLFRQINADGTTSATPVVPSKKFLYAWPYAQNTVSGTGRVAGYNYEARWVG